MHQNFHRVVFMRRARGVTYCIASNSDIAPEINEGLADFALLGSDKFNEISSNNTNLAFESVGILACRYALLGRQNMRWDGSVPVTVATSYPNAFAAFAAERNISVSRVRYLSGKVERAPISGLAETAFDLVETGDSLRANNLQILLGGPALELGGVWKT